MIPEEELAFLAAETQVDRHVKKLSGSLMFKLILFAMLETKRMSLRVMESLFLSARFRHFAQSEDLTTRHSTIRDRIARINPTYFQSIFEQLFQRYHSRLKNKFNLAAADSTYVGLSAKLLGWGMHNGRQKDTAQRQLKYSVCLRDGLPCHVRIFTEQRYISEDLALGETLSEMNLEGAVVTFDRGLQSRKAFDHLSEKGTLFIGRSRAAVRCQLTDEPGELPPKPAGSGLTVISDVKGRLGCKRGLSAHAYRLVEARIDESGQPLYLVTNCFNLTAYELAAAYRQRWQIETFFKFLKQHLNLTHLVGRSLNAITVLIYMTLITAMLILVYKQLNQLTSFKIAKLRFEIELDNLLLREIVTLCGGNPDLAAHLWNTA